MGKEFQNGHHNTSSGGDSGGWAKSGPAQAAMIAGSQRRKSSSSRRLSSLSNNKDEEEQLQLHEVVGHFGWFQLMVFIFKIGIGVTSAFNNLGVTFFAPVDFVGFWCADNIDNSSANLAVSLKTAKDLDYYQVLADFVGGQHDGDMNYETPQKLRKECSYWSPKDNRTHKCTSFKYDTGIWLNTIIEEWDLVCDRSWFISMNQSMYMSGFIVSFLVFGYLSDRFGRWWSLLIGALLEIGAGFGCALSSSAIMFMIFRFLIGFGNAGRTSASYLMMIEWVGPRWRMHISTLGSMGWIIGYCSMPWVATHYLHFRHMQLFTCFYEIIFVVWLFFLPESPRFLLTKRRFDEARLVLLKAARMNRLIKPAVRECCGKQQVSSTAAAAINQSKAFGEALAQFKRMGGLEKEAAIETELNGSSQELTSYSLEEFETRFRKLTNSIRAKEFTQNEHNLNLLDLFKWKKLRRYALILFFIWASNAFIYYGIALGVGNFGASNLFVSFTIAGLVELPSVAFTILCMKLLPRGATNVLLFTTVGLLCALQIPLKYLDLGWLQQSTMMLAKLFNSVSFTCILYQTMELFPTSIRQTAYGTCSLAGRIGSILAPFVKELQQATNAYVAPSTYTLLSLLSALLITSLPETKGADLHDTLLEAEKFRGVEKGEVDEDHEDEEARQQQTTATT